MKMFVTRLGFNSKAVITGDVTQIDLPSARRSGLLEAVDILKNVEGLTFVYFDESDVVRHHLVQRIIRAYDEHKTRLAEGQNLFETHPGVSGKSNGGGNSAQLRREDARREDVRREDIPREEDGPQAPDSSSHTDSV
jgi:phosphate starvation-inducible protein PhoH and related proteins